MQRGRIEQGSLNIRRRCWPSVRFSQLSWSPTFQFTQIEHCIRLILPSKAYQIYTMSFYFQDNGNDVTSTTLGRILLLLLLKIEVLRYRIRHLRAQNWTHVSVVYTLRQHPIHVQCVSSFGYMYVNYQGKWFMTTRVDFIHYSLI